MITKIYQPGQRWSTKLSSKAAARLPDSTLQTQQRQWDHCWPQLLPVEKLRRNFSAEVCDANFPDRLKHILQVSNTVK